MVLALMVGAFVAAAAPASAVWVCVSIVAVDSAVCVDDPLPDPLPLPDGLPVDDAPTVGL